jgi:hypothetical protein
VCGPRECACKFSSLSVAVEGAPATVIPEATWEATWAVVIISVVVVVLLIDG